MSALPQVSSFQSVRQLPLTGALLILALSVGTQARADSAEDFLKSLEGNFSGKGVAKILGDERENIACRIKNTYDPGASRLKLSGSCASTQGKDTIKGAVTNSGGKLAGTFVAPRQNIKVTKSGGTISGEKMVLNANFFDTRISSLSKIRQVITRSGKGFKAVFYTFDNKSGKYTQSGSIAFSKR